ncbi:unnamed protein product [Oncorhynchus mykiss]|uniref:Adenylate kinase n=1 Tax=Oncorhynchus mykiss TaxID=8022 RepID=A0A061AF26_ONCMY|nr:unnamed protein product [Oncorhynchus mykiss]
MSRCVQTFDWYCIYYLYICIRNNKEHPSQLSVRAQHGAAVEKFLRKGRSVPDELLVDIAVEAIRAIPADSGWILDGFPVDLTQAKLLEKALGGSDTGKERKRRNKRSNLSVDSNAPKEPPPPSPVLDLALLLDVSDDHVLDRAAKQACEFHSPGPRSVCVVLPTPMVVVTGPMVIVTQRYLDHRGRHDNTNSSRYPGCMFQVFTSIHHNSTGYNRCITVQDTTGVEQYRIQQV